MSKSKRGDRKLVFERPVLDLSVRCSEVTSNVTRRIENFFYQDQEGGIVVGLWASTGVGDGF